MVLALVLPMAGCGTRMSADQIAAADGSAIHLPVASSPAGRSPGMANDMARGSADASLGATGSAAPSTGVAPPAGLAPADIPRPAGPSRPVSPAASTAPRVLTGPDAPCTQSLTPVVLGQTSPSSGIIGATDFNMRTGMALWLRDVNARGGVQCHPVQLYQMDDAADPARVTTNLTTLVNDKKAIAIVGAGVATTFPAARRFAEQNKVPFVGGDLIEPSWFASPWLFPQGGSPLAAYAGAMKEAAAAAHTTKIGLVYCVEAAICGQINENFDAMAKASGLQVVLRKVSSITSPDYTAECQALKSAGAGAVFVAMEGSGNARFARSCRSLGYQPAIATSALAVTAEAVLDPNIRKLGAFLGAATTPFLATDSAGVRGFTAAYDRFAPGSSVDQNSITQFTAGRLFEAAIAAVSAIARTGPITRDLLLDGLWRIKNETLGGLAPPITFHRNAPPAANDCYASLTIAAAGYAAPKGGRFDCFHGLPRGY
jgi:branched-chain amino acid transport system substrate-binding protein